MYTTGLNITLFLLGICLAFVLAFLNPNMVGVLKHENKISREFKSTGLLQRSEQRASLRSDPRAAKTQLPAPVLDHRMSKEARQEVLYRALEVGSLSSLQVLRGEYLHTIPTYDAIILPELKTHLVGVLSHKFSDADWVSWSTSLNDARREKTNARNFIDDLSVVNFELGRFGETIAFLFHGLYVSTMLGKVYSVEEDLYDLVLNAEKIFQNRGPDALPARLYIDPEVSTEQAFLKALEQYRAKFTLEFYAREPSQLETGLRLVLSVQEEFISNELSQVASDLIRRLSKEGSGRYRAQIRHSILGQDSTAALMRKSPAVRLALAEFYVISAIDALEIRDLKEARELLDRSISVQPGLEAQVLVRRHLEQEQEKLVLKTEKTPIKTHDAGTKKRPALVERSVFEEPSGESLSNRIERYGILLVLSGVLLFFAWKILGIILARRALSKKNTSGGSPPGNQTSRQTVSITSPVHINFDDEEPVAKVVNS